MLSRAIYNCNKIINTFRGRDTEYTICIHDELLHYSYQLHRASAPPAREQYFMPQNLNDPAQLISGPNTACQEVVKSLSESFSFPKEKKEHKTK